MGKSQVEVPPVVLSSARSLITESMKHSMTDAKGVPLRLGQAVYVMQYGGWGMVTRINLMNKSVRVTRVQVFKSAYTIINSMELSAINPSCGQVIVMEGESP